MSVKKWAAQREDPLAKKVDAHLADDFPPESREWVNKAKWEGPKKVALADIDYSNAENWQAAHEPEKVSSFADKMREGWSKPAILIRRPGESKLMVADGHHRALASKRIGAPLLAYVADVHANRGDWDEMHASQYHAKSGDVDSTKAS